MRFLAMGFSRRELLFEIELKIQEQGIKVIQIKIEELHHLRIHLTQVDNNMGIILLLGKSLNDIAFSNTSGSLYQESNITLAFLLPFEQFLIDFSLHNRTICTFSRFLDG